MIAAIAGLIGFLLFVHGMRLAAHRKIEKRRAGLFLAGFGAILVVAAAGVL